MPNEHPPTSLETIAQTARENLLAHGSHIPTLIAEGETKTVMIPIDIVAPTHEERAQQMFVLGMALVMSGEVGVLHQVFFISEAWLSVRPTGKPLKQRPSEDPQRKEVLIVAQHVVRPPENHVVVFEMRRNPQGKLTAVETLPFQSENPNEQISSPLLEAFVVGYLGGYHAVDEPKQ